MVVSHIYSTTILVFFLTYINVYQFTSTKQKAPDNSKVHRSLQYCESSVWNLFRVTLMAAKFGGDSWVFGKICEPLQKPFFDTLCWILENSQSDLLTNKFLTCSTKELYRLQILIIYIETPSLVEQLVMYLRIRKQ